MRIRGETDSTIAPLKNSDFVLRTFHGCSTQGRILLEKNMPKYFLGCKGLSIDDVGVSRDNVFQEIQPEARFETQCFVQEKVGGIP